MHSQGPHLRVLAPLLTNTELLSLDDEPEACMPRGPWPSERASSTNAQAGYHGANVLSTDDSIGLACAAARELSLDTEDATLLHQRASVLVMLPRAGVVARVEPARDMELAKRLVAVARAFERCGSPTVRLVQPERQPLVFDAGAVTLWVRLSPVTREPRDHHTLGRLARSVRDTTRAFIRTAGDALPRLDPFQQASSWLAYLEDAPALIDTGRARALRERYNELVGRWRAQASVDRFGEALVHGDLHRDNVIMTAAGPVLIDLELSGVGPASWDLTPIYSAIRRYGTHPSKLLSFMDGYGAAPPDAAEMSLSCDIYELFAAVWAARCRHQSPRMAREADIRFAAVIGGGPPERGPRWSLL